MYIYIYIYTVTVHRTNGTFRWAQHNGGQATALIMSTAYLVSHVFCFYGYIRWGMRIVRHFLFAGGTHYHVRGIQHQEQHFRNAKHGCISKYNMCYIGLVVTWVADVDPIFPI